MGRPIPALATPPSATVFPMKITITWVCQHEWSWDSIFGCLWCPVCGDFKAESSWEQDLDTPLIETFVPKE